jgi:hypothetical protein
MRRFRVWLDKNLAGSEPTYETVEMPDSATDAECRSACAECLDTMISNDLDTGWEELPRSKPKTRRARARGAK